MKFLCDCGCTKFVGLTSMNKRICADCNKSHVWHLNKGQSPLITSSKDKGLSKSINDNNKDKSSSL